MMHRTKICAQNVQSVSYEHETAFNMACHKYSLNLHLTVISCQSNNILDNKTNFFWTDKN